MEKEVKTSFYLPKSVLVEVKKRAVDEDTTLKAIMTRYVLDGLARDKNQSKLEIEWIYKKSIESSDRDSGIISIT